MQLNPYEECNYISKRDCPRYLDGILFQKTGGLTGQRKMKNYSNKSKRLSTEQQAAAREYLGVALNQYSRAELAEALHISEASLSRILRGRQTVMPSVIVGLSILTGSPPSQIVGRPHTSHSAPFLGQYPGYVQAERALRSSAVIPRRDPEFWLLVRDIALPLNESRRVDAQKLYNFALAMSELLEDS